MRIAICEDNADDSAELCGYIDEYLAKNGCCGYVSTFSSGEALLNAFPGFQIVFLDIYLPGLSGIETARHIREIDRDCIIVFITNSPHFALDGFQVHASGYVVKPLTQEKLSDALYTCREKLNRASRTIRIPTGREGEISLPLVNLKYVEISNKVTHFHTCGGVLDTRLPLNDVEKMLGGIPFLRCHRGFIINMNYVEEIQERDFLMMGGNQVPIRKNGAKEVRLAITRFMASGNMNEVRV